MMNPHEFRQDGLQSHLFTVRLWREDVDNQAGEVRMQVKHVLSGETHYFRDWQALVEYLQRVMQEADQTE